ncbi:unnamed protein product [Cladocopium goreaui]|uniref:Uncharacterized protein n=1 Tax=Cladocopium goreaui TaxID=2562237 RepID=A0A9P1GIK1_9DINO|nr:unnamed protein product [Cladocopium goreaui]
MAHAIGRRMGSDQYNRWNRGTAPALPSSSRMLNPDLKKTARRGHQRRAHLRSAAAAHMLTAVPSEKGVGVALSELCSDNHTQCQLEQCRLDLDCVVLADGMDEIQWNPPCNVWQKYSFGIFWHAIIESAGLSLNYILTSTRRVDAAWLNDVRTLRMKMTAFNANGWNGATYQIWNASNVGQTIDWQLTMRDSMYAGWNGNEWYLKDESDVILANGTMNSGLFEEFVTFSTTVGTVLKFTIDPTNGGTLKRQHQQRGFQAIHGTLTYFNNKNQMNITRL